MEIKRNNALNFKSRLLMSFGVVATLCTLVIVYLNLLFFSIFVSALNGLKNSHTPEEYSYGTSFIIIGIVGVVTLIISSVSTFGVWKAYARVKKAIIFSWFQKISLLIAALLCLGTIIISFKLLL